MGANAEQLLLDALVLVGLCPGMPMTLDESSLTKDPAAATTIAHDLTLPKLKYSFNLI